MTYWKLKGCPKCHGDVCVENQDYSATAYCLQCGGRSYILKSPKVECQAEDQRRELVVSK